MKKFAVSLSCLFGVVFVFASFFVEKGLPGQGVSSEELVLVIAKDKGVCENKNEPCKGSGEICTNTTFNSPYTTAACSQSGATGNCPSASPSNKKCNFEIESDFICFNNKTICCKLPKCEPNTYGTCGPNGELVPINTRDVC